MADYTSFISLVNRLISKFGGDFTVTRNPSIENVNKPWEQGQDTSENFQVKLAIFQVGLVGRDAFNFIDQTQIPTGAELAYLGNDGSFVPKISDIIFNDNFRWRVVRINIVAPDGTPILYILEIEK